MSAQSKGWRETIEPGLYRAHRLACPSSADRKPGRRCGCSIEVKVPGARAGTTRTVTLALTIPQARAERRRLLADGRPARPAEPAPAHGSLNEFTAAYFRARAPVLSPTTIHNRSYDYRRRIAPPLGDLTLGQITRERVEVWLAELVATASSHREIVQTVATLRVILATAREWGKIAENPAARLKLPPAETNVTQAVERVIDREQVARLVAGAGTPRTATMIRAAAEAGLRRGEVAGLQWPDVELADRRLYVRRAIVQVRKRRGQPMRKVEQPTKGRKRRRVAISAEFAAALGDWFTTAVIEGGADAAGYVWQGKDGGPMHDRSLGRAVERACGRAGLVDAGGKPLVTSHGLRHSAASIMLMAGVPLLIVSRQLGHSNPQITATTYAHLLGDDQLDRAADAFTVEEIVDES